MSCFISKQILRTGTVSKDNYNVAEDIPFNSIINGILWNLKFSAIFLVVTILLWSRNEIFGFLAKGLRRGEDFVRVEQHTKAAKPDEENDNSWTNSLKSFRKWFWLDRNFLTETCEESGFEYLCFQRYVMVFQMILCAFGLAIILPINMKIGKNAKEYTFASTTMSNLVPKDHHDYFWVHIIFSLLLLPGTLFCMKLFFYRIETPEEEKTLATELGIRRTLFLSGLPSDMRNPAAIIDYFDTKYPGSNIQYIRVNVSVNSLEELENEHALLEDILSECRSGKETNELLFNKVSSCCKCCVDGTPEPIVAIDYYEEQKLQVERKLKLGAEKILQENVTIDSAFVQVGSLETARQIGEIVVHLILLQVEAGCCLSLNYAIFDCLSYILILKLNFFQFFSIKTFLESEHSKLNLHQVLKTSNGVPWH